MRDVDVEICVIFYASVVYMIVIKLMRFEKLNMRPKGVFRNFLCFE